MVCTFSLVATLHGVAQNIPAVLPSTTYNGFSLPRIGGDLHYALTGSEAVDLGYNGTNDNVSLTSLSGDVAYLSVSKSNPFSLVYAGGYNVATSDQPSIVFHNLSMSQVLTFGRWSAVAANTTRYLPQTATLGLSGLPGQGDLGIGPTNPVGVLTNNASQVGNTVSGTVSRQLSGINSLSGTGTWQILRFVGDSGNQGFDNNQATGTAVFNHRINPLTSASVIYSYSRSTFPGFSSSFVSQGVSIEYSRQWNRKFNTDVSVGPQRTTGNFDPIYNLTANASMAYTGNGYGMTAAYVQTTNTGAGTTTGAKSNAATAGFNRNLGPVWNLAATFAYTRTTGLPIPGSSNFSSKTFIGGGQMSRQLNRSLSMYASYTAERQLLGNFVSQTNAFSGFTQIIGFGVTYAPRSVKFGRE